MRSTNIIERHIPCEECGSSDAKCVYDDGHSFCFSCNHYFPGDKSFDLSEDTYTYEYIPVRGINKDTLRQYDVKTKIDKEGKPISIGFRYPNGAYKVRLLDKKDFYSQGEIAKAGLFGKDKFAAGSSKFVTITEGEYDALSLSQVLGPGYPVVSVQSATVAARDCSLERSYLNSFERVYLAFDADAAGREAAHAVARLFDYNKVWQVRFTKHKDANDFLQAGEGDTLRHIWWNSRRYQPESIVSSFDEFEEVLKTKPKEGVKAYPSYELNEMTYGIRTAESVLITAQEGIGKTELMHTIEFNLLKGTTDNVGAIFLEEPKRRHLQAIGGLELERPVHLPDCGVADTEVFSALKTVVNQDDRLHVYSHFGSDDPDVLLDTVRFLTTARNCRYIMLDHISMVVSGLAGEDERKALDYIATRLEMMVKELDFALVVVSHVNDFGQTRGSRYISRIADIRIDMTRDLKEDWPCR